MKNLNTENIKPFTKKIGIYKIKINNKIYIGSSVNVKNRLRVHLQTLKGKKHHNKTMQNLFNKYGENEIYFELVEECEKDILIDREKYYMNILKPYINHILDPVKLTRDDTFKKRISESKKEYYKTNDPVNIKVVYQYNLEGLYLNEYKSVTEAAKSITTEESAITAICACCNGRGYTAKGFKWSYEKVNILKEKKKKYKTKEVFQYDLDDVFIKKWESKTLAQKELNITNISRAVREGKTAGGFKWKDE